MTVPDTTTPDGDNTTIMIPLEHPWCPTDRPYPESYAAALAQNPDLCVAVDPCQPDGTTLWHIDICDSIPTTTTTQAFNHFPASGRVLPATGSFTAVGLAIAVIAAAVGVVLARTASRSDD